jgi:hypothetical protein
VNKLVTLAGLGGFAGLAVVAVLAETGRAADRTVAHTEQAALVAPPMADIADLYAWMTGANLNLVMDVSPLDNGTRNFDPAVLYVFHLTSKPGLGVGGSSGTETRIVCRFASNTSVECWVTGATGTKDYAAGDPSTTAGLRSQRGKFRVFAGRRSDPAFFNQGGFARAVTQIKAVLPSQPDGFGCPRGLDQASALAIRNDLASGSDAFAASNVMAIVVQIDTSLVNADNNTTIAVWGASHAGS